MQAIIRYTDVFNMGQGISSDKIEAGFISESEVSQESLGQRWSIGFATFLCHEIYLSVGP